MTGLFGVTVMAFYWKRIKRKTPTLVNFFTFNVDFILGGVVIFFFFKETIIYPSFICWFSVNLSIFIFEYRNGQL